MQLATPAKHAPATTPYRPRWRRAEPVIRRVLILVVLFGQIAYKFSRGNVDPDLWWHLATGRWIVENGGLPSTDPFSEYGNGRPWVAYTWLFDLLIFKVYRAFGLLGIEFLKATLALVLGVTLYCLLQKLGRSFGLGVLLTGLAVSACLPLATPRPWLFTIVLFTLELVLLTRLRNDRGRFPLLLLPVLFAFWANVHIQFVYGLVLIGVFFAEALEERWWRSGERYTGRWASAKLYGILLIACGAAACLNPYGFSIYRTVWTLANQTSIYLMIQDLSPPNFRSPTHWIFLGLMVAAIFATGRRRTRSVLPYLLLLLGLFTGLRMQRDIWVGAVAAAAVLSGWPSGRRIVNLDPDWVPDFKVVLAVTIASLIVASTLLQQKEADLQQQVEQHFPVAAAQFISAHSEKERIFNDFGWGGYLTWALPGRRVSIDGRTHIHVPVRVIRSYRTWSGSPDWSSDPDLQKAKLILAPRHFALVSILRLDPRYQLVYEDQLSVIFKPRARKTTE